MGTPSKSLEAMETVSSNQENYMPSGLMIRLVLPECLGGGTFELECQPHTTLQDIKSHVLPAALQNLEDSNKRWADGKQDLPEPSDFCILGCMTDEQGPGSSGNFPLKNDTPVSALQTDSSGIKLFLESKALMYGRPPKDYHRSPSLPRSSTSQQSVTAGAKNNNQLAGANGQDEKIIQKHKHTSNSLTENPSVWVQCWGGRYLLSHEPHLQSKQVFCEGRKSWGKGIFCAGVVQGWLKKKSRGLLSGWRNRYFALFENNLCYWVKKESALARPVGEPRGMFQTSKFISAHPDPKDPTKFYIELESQKEEACGNDRLQLQANDERTSEFWIRALTFHTKHNGSQRSQHTTPTKVLPLPLCTCFYFALSVT